MRKTVGADISSEQYRLFKMIAESNGVSVAAYLRAMIVDVLAEESATGIRQPLQCHLRKMA